MTLQMYPYIQLGDGLGNTWLYAVVFNTYSRKWQRAFSSQLAGNIIRLNFIDKGPGVRVYDMQLLIATWAPGSVPYKAGITQTWDQQYQNLQNSYAQNATVLQFVDPMGLSPTPVTGGAGDYGVYFTDFNIVIPQYSTSEKPYLLVQIELTEATQVVNP